MATKINTALTNPNSSKKVDPQKQEPTKDDKKVKNDLPIYAQIANKMNKTKTVQQRLFVGDSALNFKNLEIQKWIGKNEEMLGLIGGEYNKIKKLLLRYKIIKEQLELQYLKKAKQMKRSMIELKRRQDELETKQEENLKTTQARDKKYKDMQKFINNLKGPLEKFRNQLNELNRKDKFQEKEVRKMFKNSGENQQKIEEYWQIIRKVDELMEPLNKTITSASNFMEVEEAASKGVAEELKDLKAKLIVTTQQVGGQNMNKIAKQQNINDNFIKLISNPIQHKLNNTMTGGGKINSKKLWIKDNGSYIFKNYSRTELNNIAKKWGIKNPKQFKNKSSLTSSLKILMLYKGGYIQKRKHYNTICHNLGTNSKQFKNIKQIKSYLNKQLKNVIV